LAGRPFSPHGDSPRFATTTACMLVPPAPFVPPSAPTRSAAAHARTEGSGDGDGVDGGSVVRGDESTNVTPRMGTYERSARACHRSIASRWSCSTRRMTSHFGAGSCPQSYGVGDGTGVGVTSGPGV